MAVDAILKLSEREMNELTLESLETIKMVKSYDGPTLRFPLTLPDVLAMLESFKNMKVLHYKYIMMLFLCCEKICVEESTVQHINIPPGVQVTVIGDTHGQLLDLLTIFNIKGLPCEKNRFLFNGDFVDRGRYGCEIVAIICAFKILYPEYVYINRGNHEARAQNSWMGFEDEILAKYTNQEVVVRNDRRAGLRLHMLCEKLFDSFPLCAVIQHKVFVCHGGLFRDDNVTLADLDAINRKREPPLGGRSYEDRLYEDILWSDPRPTPSYPKHLLKRRSSDRGAGCEFGPQVTAQFCALNQIALVVRSHECVADGFEVLHDGRLITIFSASRYCGTQTNKGAFMTFGEDLQPEIQQFFALGDVTSFMTEEERQTKLEEDAVFMIVEMICDHKLDLYWYFTERDKAGAGVVSRVEWANGLTKVLNLDVPFLYYQPKLAELDENGKVNFSRFLSRFQVALRDADMGWQERDSPVCMRQAICYLWIRHWGSVQTL